MWMRLTIKSYLIFNIILKKLKLNIKPKILIKGTVHVLRVFCLQQPLLLFSVILGTPIDSVLRLKGNYVPLITTTSKSQSPTTPCHWLCPSHYRAESGFTPVETCASRAHQKEEVPRNTPSKC